MKKIFNRLLTFLICFATMSISACSGEDMQSTHECLFDQKIVSQDYLSETATCQRPTSYYYSCACGKAGTETFFDGVKLEHDFTAEIVDAKYIRKTPNCLQEGEYYKSCVHCGQASYLKTFKTEKGGHVFTQEVKEGKYLKTEATLETEAVYYKSCICGLVGEETFLGEKLREYTEQEKVPYQPTSLTVSLYDSQNSVYGFTYNTEKEPLRPVIQVRLMGEEEWTEYSATVEQMSSYKKNGGAFNYYISKTEVDLEPNKTYEYRAYDKYVDVGTKIVTFNTKNPKAETFTFAHVSDTQEFPDYFKTVLSKTAGKVDFLLHTGDFVQEAKYESLWTDMLQGNFEYISQIPIMAIAGNHDTAAWGYGVSHETYKHFNYNLPEQKTKDGIYYSFVYGNVKFLMLNTSIGELSTAHYNWLENELKNNTCDWTIVATHMPLYSPGRWGSEPSSKETSLRLRSQLQALFAEYSVDLVLQGHDHVISRTHPINNVGEVQSETWIEQEGINYSIDPNGVVYLMDGTAGGQVRSPNWAHDPSLYKYALTSNAASWAEFTVSDDKLTVVVKYGADEEIYESWGIKKTK